MSGFHQRLEGVLADRQQNHLYRQRLTLESAQGPVVHIAGREYSNFCSNDYLGLAAHPELIASYQKAADLYGVGSGASHLVCGHSAVHHQLEEALAELTGRPRALLFSSGYMANMGVLGALLERGDTVLQDRLNHASLLDAGLHSGARFQRFLHNDLGSLSRKLERATGDKLVVVDGVFSMDGDAAPLRQIASACQQHDAWLMVDDAHGFGVMGATGAGSLEESGLDLSQAPILMATLGKAMGTAGAFVAGSDTLIEALIQLARNYIYTTAIPPAVAAATLTALDLLHKEQWRREHLRDLIGRFRAGARELGLPLLDSNSAIQPLMVGDSGRAVSMSEQLLTRGILAGAIRPPTVPAGTARLRITLSAGHTHHQVEQLLEQLADCWAVD